MGLRYLTILSAPAAFTPKSIAGLRVWLDASDPTTINAGSPVNNDPISTWTDKSTNAYSFTASGALRPTYQTSVQNSLSIARGTSSLIGAAAGTDLTAYSIFVVVKITTYRSDDTIVGSNIQNTGQNTIALSGSNALGVWFANIAGGYKMPTGTNSVTTGTFYIINVTYTSVTPAGVFYIGNVSLGTTSQASGFLSMNNMNLFDDGAAGFTNLRGDIGETIVYDSVLSSTNQNSVYNYLKAKWGL